MAQNLAGKTYEVFVGEGKRWIYDSTHKTRSAALEVAEELLDAANHDGVRLDVKHATNRPPYGLASASRNSVGVTIRNFHSGAGLFARESKSVSPVMR